MIDGSPSDGANASWNNSTIAVRSNHDRATIAPHSLQNRSIFVRRQFLEHLEHDRRSIVADCAKIVAYFEALFEAKFKPNHPGFEATMPLSANHSHDVAIDAHDPLHHSRFQAQFPSLKSHVLLHCSSTFDQFVKELSKFRGISLVHCDSPAFRLNSKGIGAGLITKSSLISSNFPFEFRKSVGKDPSKFTPIRANWSLILAAIVLVVRFDQLSRGNLSFY